MSATVVRLAKNGDNSLAAVDILAICCKSVITIFIFAVFDVSIVITPLSGVINYVFCIYYSTTTNTNIKLIIKNLELSRDAAATPSLRH